MNNHRLVSQSRACLLEHWRNVPLEGGHYFVIVEGRVFDPLKKRRIDVAVVAAKTRAQFPVAAEM